MIMTHLADGEHARDIAVAQNIQYDVPSKILEGCSHDSNMIQVEAARPCCG
jgi:hypothetical protein